MRCKTVPKIFIPIDKMVEEVNYFATRFNGADVHPLLPNKAECI